jgi:outer membrane protein, heavy metal efflux system
MKFLLSALLVVLAVSASAQTHHAQSMETTHGLAGFSALFAAQPMANARAPAISLDEAERIALANNPEITVAARRVAVSKAHLPVAGALSDPSAMYRAWGIPLNQPGNLNAAQNMFSISQTFPGRGKRALESSIARSDVDIAQSQLAQVRLLIRVRVRKAFNDLLRAQEEMRIHDQHVALARQAIEAARIKYAVGKVSQQDILKAQVSLTALAEHLIRFDEDADLARARLNTLLGRNPSTPVRALGSYSEPTPLPGLDQLESIALRSRPDLQAAGQMVQRSRKESALAHKAMTPDFTVAGGYMLMQPTASMRNTYMLEGSMTLPWLNRGRHKAEIAEAAVKFSEQDAELDALRNEAFGQIQEALVEARSSQRLAAIYHDQLRPQAEATLQASVIAYENDQTDFLNLLDSQMTVINIDLAWLQAAADYDTRLADLELATGSMLDTTLNSAPEVKP